MIRINLVKLYQSCNYETNLIPYMLKILLLEHGFPIILDPLQVSDKRITLRHGVLEFSYSSDGIYLYVKKLS